ncbi:MAG: hypothetical protein Q7U85_04555 [Rhodocyclaceae bacterium]|nr:hypothetical protein [Rhodocyclaceae bacterium]
MMKLSSALLAALVAATLLSACTQMPTERQGVTDLRPQLSFKITDEALRAARVLVDGLDMGAVDEYGEGVAALRILPGVHVIRVVLHGRTVIEEKLYVADGVNRTLRVQ